MIVLQALIPSAIQGLSTYLGNRAQKKAQEDVYKQSMQALAEQQGLETQGMTAGLDYEQNLANRGIGENAAATGMTGSATSGKLSDITAARREAMRKLYLSQLMQRKQMESAKAEQDIQAKATQKAAIYQGLGQIGGQIASDYFNPATPTTIDYKLPDMPSIPNNFMSASPKPYNPDEPLGLKNAFKQWTGGGYSNIWGGK